jgi:hypothetical protein
METVAKVNLYYVQILLTIYIDGLKILAIEYILAKRRII